MVFDARHLQTQSRSRGIGRYSRNLLAAFARQGATDIDWTLLRLANFPPPGHVDAPPHRDRRTFRLRRPELSMLALDPFLLSAELLGTGAQIFHSVQLGLPLARWKTRAVLTIHDLAPMHWPEHYLRLPHARVGHVWQYALARFADAIIAVSAHTKSDVVARLGIPEERVHVIAEAVDADFRPPGREAGRGVARERFGVEGRYVVYVGQFDPRKNMDELLRAFGAAAATEPDLRLVIVGRLGKLASFLRQALERTRAPRERIVVTDEVDEATLAALYAGAECLLHAALLEGFGLTPLESLAAGTPVVGYRAGAVAEVVGDAGLLVEPATPGALADALVAFLADPALADRLRARAASRAALFSWDRAAARTLDVYRAVG